MSRNSFEIRTEEELYLDGIELNNVMSYSLQHIAGELAELTVTMEVNVNQQEEVRKMKRPIISDMEMDKLAEMCKPIVDYLQENYDPYVEVHISVDEIKVTSVECSIHVESDN